MVLFLRKTKKKKSQQSKKALSKKDKRKQLMIEPIDLGILIKVTYLIYLYRHKEESIGKGQVWLNQGLR